MQLLCVMEAHTIKVNQATLRMNDLTCLFNGKHFQFNEFKGKKEPTSWTVFSKTPKVEG
jgi:hypothetical protein